MTEETDQELTDLLPSNGQIDTKAYVYRVTPNDDMPFYITVIATNSTSARIGLKHQYKNCAITFIGVSERIMQVNG